MTPPAKTFKGSKINYFRGSIALCRKGSIAPGFSSMLALLVNIIREMITLILGPWLARVFGRYAPTAAAGVTSMDVTLPMIIRCTGQEMFPIALMHGIVLEVSVPILVTLFASL